MPSAQTPATTILTSEVISTEIKLRPVQDNRSFDVAGRPPGDKLVWALCVVWFSDCGGIRHEGWWLGNLVNTNVGDGLSFINLIDHSGSLHPVLDMYVMHVYLKHMITVGGLRITDIFYLNMLPISSNILCPFSPRCEFYCSNRSVKPQNWAKTVTWLSHIFNIVLVWYLLPGCILSGFDLDHQLRTDRKTVTRISNILMPSVFGKINPCFMVYKMNCNSLLVIKCTLERHSLLWRPIWI